MSIETRLAWRLVRGAGSRDVVRFAAMVVGVAVALASILIGLAVPRVSASVGEVQAARTPRLSTTAPGEVAAGPALRVSVSNETLGVRPWTRVTASGVSAAVRPPGLSGWPSPGHAVVSPELARLLAVDPAAGGGLGVIDAARVERTGLTGPDELVSYSVSDQNEPVADIPVVGFGAGAVVAGLGSPTSTLLIETVLFVVLPALVFLFLSLQLSAASRKDRAFVLGLVGLSPARNARVYALEMTLTASVGAALGLTLFGFGQGWSAAQGRWGCVGSPSRPRLA